MAMNNKPPLGFGIVAGVFLVGSIVCCIWHYATVRGGGTTATTPLHLLLTMLYLMPFFGMAGILWDVKQITLQRTAETVAAATSDILGLLAWAALTSLFILGVLPKHSAAWLFPVAFVAIPLFASIGNGPLVNKHPHALLKHGFGALLAGSLTALQLAMVSHSHTWLFIVVGVIPIPVLAITTGLTALATVMMTSVVASAVVYYPLCIIFIRRK